MYVGPVSDNVATLSVALAALKHLLHSGDPGVSISVAEGGAAIIAILERHRANVDQAPRYFFLSGI